MRSSVREWICETVQLILTRFLITLKENRESGQAIDDKWQKKLDKLTIQVQDRKKIAQIVLIEQQNQDPQYVTISDGTTHILAKLNHSSSKERSYLESLGNLNGCTIEIFNCTLALAPESKSLKEIMLDVQGFHVLTDISFQKCDRHLDFWQNKELLEILENIESLAAKSEKSSEESFIASQTQNTSLVNHDVSNLSLGCYKSQISKEHPEMPVHKIIGAKDSRFSREKLLGMLDSAKESLSPSNSEPTSQFNEEHLLLSVNKNKISEHEPLLADQVEEMLSKLRPIDESLKSSSQPKTMLQDALPKQPEMQLTTPYVTGAANCKPISVPENYRQEHPGERYQHIPNRFILIPTDQRALLDTGDCFFHASPNQSDLYARLPPKVSDFFGSFLNKFVEPKKGSMASEPLNHHHLKSIVNFHQPNNSRVDTQSIPRHFIRIPDDQKQLINQEDSWFRANDDFSNVYARIPIKTSEEFTLFLRSDLSQSIPTEGPSQKSVIELDQSRQKTSVESRITQNDDKNNIETFSPTVVEELRNSCSQTPEFKSRSTSIQEILTVDPIYENLDISQSYETQASVPKNCEMTPKTMDMPHETSYSKFRLTYPQYRGSRRDFTWALVYIEWLHLYHQDLDSGFWDDFVRVLASEYPEDICSSKSPTTGLEYYKKSCRQCLFDQKVICPQTLEASLLSLDEREVEYFREAFRMERKKLIQTNSLQNSHRTVIFNGHVEKSPQTFIENLRDTVEFLDTHESSTEACSRLEPGYTSKEVTPATKYVSQSSSDYNRNSHLRTWRQFLHKRKINGTLNSSCSSVTIRKRYCTLRKAEHCDRIL